MDNTNNIDGINLTSPYSLSPTPSNEEFERINESAKGGNAENQLYMGHFYMNGDGVAQDFEQAVQWYQKAAAQGNARGQYYLGMLYDYGIGVEADYGAALKLYMAAVKQNDLAAHWGIAGFHFLYRKSYLPQEFGSYGSWRAKAIIAAGITTSKPSFEEQFWNKYNEDSPYWQNDSAVINELLKRSHTGNVIAKLDLAKMILHAQGVSRDIVLVRALIGEAARDGSHNAMFILGATSEYNRLLNDVSLTDYIKKAAESPIESYFSSYYHRLFINEQFRIMRKNEGAIIQQISQELAYHFNELEKNANNGDVYAQFWSGFYLKFYKNQEQKAYRMIEQAAIAGHYRAQAFRGMMILYGIGTEQNIVFGKNYLDHIILRSSDGIQIALREAISYCHSRYPERTSLLQAYFQTLDLQNDINSPFYLGIVSKILDKSQHNSGAYFLRAHIRGCRPASYLLALEAERGNLNIDTAELEKIESPGVALLLPKQQYLRVLFPAAEHNYGPAIVLVFRSIILHHDKAPNEVIQYWLNKLLDHPQWYNLGTFLETTSSVLDDYYNFKYDSFLRPTTTTHDSINLLY